MFEEFCAVKLFTFLAHSTRCVFIFSVLLVYFVTTECSSRPHRFAIRFDNRKHCVRVDARQPIPRSLIGPTTPTAAPLNRARATGVVELAPWLLGVVRVIVSFERVQNPTERTGIRTRAEAATQSHSSIILCERVTDNQQTVGRRGFLPTSPRDVLPGKFR